MEIEELEVFDFLRSTTPLENISKEHIASLIAHTHSFYRRRGSIITLSDTQLYLIHKGAVHIQNEAANVIELLAEHDWFGVHDSLLPYQHICKEDTLCYSIEKEEFYTILSSYSEVTHFFISSTNANANVRTAHTFLSDSVVNLSRALDAIVVNEHTAIYDVATMMTQKNTTAILVVDENNALSGIVTDRAMCTKVVAQKLDSKQSISTIMTPNPITIQQYENGSKAMLDMAKSGIRHLPIMDNARVVGILTAADLLRKQSHNVVFLLGEINQAKSIQDLVKVSKHLPLTLTSSVDNNLDEHHIAYSLSSIGRAILVRLIKQFEAVYGSAPISYAFVVAGSQARGEQILHSDQDNVMILSDEYDSVAHGTYFKELATYVSDGLDQCGYIYCLGNIMATNIQWRTTLSQWKKYFRGWICTPEPQALLNASIFFDMKCLYGDTSLLDALRQEIFSLSESNTIFLSHMTANALQFQPPLGFFRNFIYDKNENQEDALDLKKRGVTPIIDMVRVYTISHKVYEINTTDRMNKLLLEGGMSVSGASELIEAYTVINTLRIKHQAEQVKKELPVNNLLQPSEISSLNKKYLKDAFSIVSDMQSAMGSSYGASILS